MELKDKEKGWVAKFRGVHIMEITTIIGCKNMCSYCPQDVIIKAYKGYKGIRLLSFENFKKILENIPKDVELYFAGHSEPFLNKESSLMLKYAIESGYNVVMYTTLVGFTDNDLEILASINGQFGGIAFHRFDGVGYDREDFNRKQNLVRTKVLGIDPIPMDDDTSGRVVGALSRAGNVWEETARSGKLFCSSAPKFDNNSMMPNGDVYLCCMDYGLKHKLGNLMETHYDQLDRSVVNELASKEESDILCRKCVVARYH